MHRSLATDSVERRIVRLPWRSSKNGNSRIASFQPRRPEYPPSDTLDACEEDGVNRSNPSKKMIESICEHTRVLSAHQRFDGGRRRGSHLHRRVDQYGDIGRRNPAEKTRYRTVTHLHTDISPIASTGNLAAGNAQNHPPVMYIDCAPAVSSTPHPPIPSNSWTRKTASCSFSSYCSRLS